MPSYDVGAAEFHERVAEIEKSERVVSVVAAGDGAYKVVTESRDQRRASGQKETR
jgi:hypothetical protein